MAFTRLLGVAVGGKRGVRETLKARKNHQSLRRMDLPSL